MAKTDRPTPLSSWAQYCSMGCFVASGILALVLAILMDSVFVNQESCIENESALAHAFHRIAVEPDPSTLPTAEDVQWTAELFTDGVIYDTIVDVMKEIAEEVRKDKEKKEGEIKREGVFGFESLAGAMLSRRNSLHRLEVRKETSPVCTRSISSNVASSLTSQLFARHDIAVTSPLSREMMMARLGTATTPRAASPRAASPRAASPRAASPRAASPRAASPRAASPPEHHEQHPRAPPRFNQDDGGSSAQTSRLENIRKSTIIASPTWL